VRRNLSKLTVTLGKEMNFLFMEKELEQDWQKQETSQSGPAAPAALHSQQQCQLTFWNQKMALLSREDALGQWTRVTLFFSSALGAGWTVADRGKVCGHSP
jgi:hypothetical protein